MYLRRSSALLSVLIGLLPKIDCQDPMAKWIGARPGDVVEITGLCEASCENKRYRYCVADVTNG